MPKQKWKATAILDDGSQIIWFGNSEAKILKAIHDDGLMCLDPKVERVN